MKKLEKIKSQIETNIRIHLDAEEKRSNDFYKKNDIGLTFNRTDYDYLVYINEDENAVSIIFDGGMFYDLINTHFIQTGEGAEDYREEFWFCSKTAEKIFDLSKYDWDKYASYQIDVYAD